MILSMFSDHIGVIPKISKKQISRKSLQVWKLTSKILNNPQVKEETHLKPENILNYNQSMTYQNLQSSAKVSLREIYSLKFMNQERKAEISDLGIHLGELEKQ